MCAYNLPYDETLFLQIQKEFNATYGHLSDPVSVVDLNVPGVPFVAVNRAYASMHGYEIEELLGQAQDIIHPVGRRTPPNEDVDRRTRAQEFLNHEQSGTGRALHLHKDGSIFKVTYAMRLEKLAGLEFVLAKDTFFGFIDNNTPIFSWQNLFQKMAEPLSEGVVLVDPDAKMAIVDCNEGYASLSGYRRNELIGKTFADLSEQQEPDRYARWLENEISTFVKLIHGVGTFQCEMFHPHKDGRIDPVFVTITIAEVDNHEYLLYNIRNTNTDRRQRLMDTQRDEILQSIAANRDLDATLNQIALFTQQQITDVRCAILLRQDKWDVKAAPSLSTQDILALEQNSDLENGPVQQTMNQGLPVVATGEFLPLLENEVHGCWTYPVAPGAQIRGVVAVFVREPERSPQFRDTEILRQSVSLATIAIEHDQWLKRLEHQAGHDYLTGLPNRQLFEDRLQQVLLAAQRQGESAAILFLDLDGFKNVNDTLGHAAGDVLLQQVAKRLQDCVRRSDTVARMGGDEFSLILPRADSNESVAAIAQKILEAIQEPFEVLDHEVFVTTSIGITFYPRDAQDSSTLQRHADTAMYRSKNAGKNRYAFFEESWDVELQDRFYLKQQLKSAFETNQFELYYQPQLQAASGATSGMEALLRWHHPRLGTVLPLSFIPAAEESGIILKIGTWVINRACAQMRQWRELGIAPETVAINVSALQFGRTDLIDVVQNAIVSNDIPPQCLELEITESVVMRDQQETFRQAARLKNLGVHLTIDDFGTGYSSLSYLQKLPISRLKIDRSFTRDIHTSQGSRSLVESVIRLGHSLDMKVIAEGVCHKKHLHILRDLGCDMVQGFAIAPALLPQDATEFLKKHPSAQDDTQFLNSQCS